MTIDVRKTRVFVEEIYRDRGPAKAAPLRVAAAQAVIANPLSGGYVADVMPFMAELRSLGTMLSKQLVEALGGADHVVAYGKGAIVGEDGELEHGALWHEAGGWALREVLGNRKAMMPSAKTVGVMGTRLIVPMGHTHAAYVRSHMSVTEVGMSDAPRRDELLLALVGATGGRIEARCGGLLEQDVIGEDGLY